MQAVTVWYVGTGERELLYYKQECVYCYCGTYIVLCCVCVFACLCVCVIVLFNAVVYFNIIIGYI